MSPENTHQTVKVPFWFRVGGNGQLHKHGLQREPSEVSGSAANLDPVQATITRAEREKNQIESMKYKSSNEFT